MRWSWYRYRLSLGNLKYNLPALTYCLKLLILNILKLCELARSTRYKTGITAIAFRVSQPGAVSQRLQTPPRQG
jgi:hypothetical protein